MHEESGENNGIIKDIIHGIVSNINKESNDDHQYSDLTLKELYSLSQLSKSNENVIVEPENIEKACLLPLKNDETQNKRSREEISSDEAPETSEENLNPEKKEKMEFENAEHIVRKQLKRISRDELEELVARKVVEMVTCRSELGELRAKCDKLEEINDFWKNKTKGLEKMCQDLNIVVKRYVLDVQNQKKYPTPIKITRSVGLQVMSEPKARHLPIQPESFVQSSQKVQDQQGTSNDQRLTPTTSTNYTNADNAIHNKQSFIKQAGNTTFVSTLNNTNSKTTLPNASGDSLNGASSRMWSNVEGHSRNMNGSTMKKISPVSRTNFLSSTVPKKTNSRKQDNQEKKEPRSRSPEITIVGVKPSKPTVNGQIPRSSQQVINATVQNGLPEGCSHPAPLPDMPNPQPHSPSWKKLPQVPILKISRMEKGIVLEWQFGKMTDEYEEVQYYQIFAYQEGPELPQSRLWKKIGDVKALPLPMACTLTQFGEGNRYHFAVRAQDIHLRVGGYSAPQSISLN